MRFFFLFFLLLLIFPTTSTTTTPTPTSSSIILSPIHSKIPLLTSKVNLIVQINPEIFSPPPP